MAEMTLEEAFEAATVDVPSGMVDDIFVIDAPSRKIIVPDSESTFGVETDKDVERKYFRCPRIVGDNIDLYAHKIYVVYVTAKDVKGTFLPEIINDRYWCEDVAVDGDYITFSWKLSDNVMSRAGIIAFKVLAVTTDGEFEKTRWNTAPAYGTILMTVPDGDDIAERYPDIVTQLLERMDAVEAIATPEAMQGYVNEYLGQHPVQLDETLTDNTKAAPAGVVGELKGDLDTLNQGGLNLKDEVIAEDINNWLYEHPEATTTVQDGGITEPKIHADFLPYIKNEYVTPKMFGAVGDGVTDDTEALKKCLIFCEENKFEFVIPIGIYKISESLILHSNFKIRGVDKFNSVLLCNEDIPIITVVGGTTGTTNLSIENIHFAPRSRSKTKYTLDLLNTSNTTVRNCYISGQEMNGESDVEGIRFAKTKEYTGPHFVNKIESCQLNNASVIMESTDSYIINNEIWGGYRKYCVHIIKSSQFVSGNQLVPSESNGAILIKDTVDNYEVELIRINNNFFDGSYENLDAGDGIIAIGTRLSNINNNDFWKIKQNGLVLTNCYSNNINANIFTDCNLLNNSYDDVKATSCTNNNFICNTHKQQNTMDSKGKAYNFIDSTGTNIVSENTVYFIQNYSSSKFTKYEDVNNNNGLSQVHSYAFNNATAFTTKTGSETSLKFTNIFSSTDDLVSIQDNAMKINKSGFYQILYNIGSTNGNGARFALFLYKNAQRHEKINDKVLTSNDCLNGCFIEYLKEGEIIEIKYYTDKEIYIESSPTDNYIKLTRI